MENDKLIKEYLRLNGLTLEELLELKDSSYVYQDFSEAEDSVKFIDALHERLDSKRVVIDTDYDCDGVMSGVILEASLKKFGFNVSLYYPSEHDGYGLTMSEAEKILNKFPDVDLVVTADSGINCKEAIDFLVSKDVDVLVSDHHKGEVDLFPDSALACVDVNRSDKVDNYRFKHISGAQTAFKLMMMYASKYESQSTVTYIRSLRVLAAVSVLSDVMLMDDENRELVKELLTICNTDKLAKMAMTNEYLARFKEFLDQFGSGKITQQTFGFALIPTINSNRRMLGESDLAFKVFDRNPVVRARSINALMRLNDLRKSTKKLAQSSANIVLDEEYLKIAVVDADQGILGLVASDFANSNECASLAFRKSGDRMTASGRGNSKIEIYRLLEEVKKRDSSIDFNFGGHANALGCGVALKDFDRFCEVCKDVSNEIFDSSMRKADRSVRIGSFHTLVSDLKFQDEIISICKILESIQPLPHYLEDLQLSVAAEKVELLSVGFENFGKSNEHLKYRDDLIEIVGFFKFEEFYNSDLDDRFEFKMNVSLENSKIKCIIDKVRKMND